MIKIKLLRDIYTDPVTKKAGTVYILQGIAALWIAIPLGNDHYHKLHEGDYEIIK